MSSKEFFGLVPPLPERRENANRPERASNWPLMAALTEGTVESTPNLSERDKSMAWSMPAEDGDIPLDSPSDSVSRGEQLADSLQRTRCSQVGPASPVVVDAPASSTSATRVSEQQHVSQKTADSAGAGNFESSPPMPFIEAGQLQPATDSHSWRLQPQGNAPPAATPQSAEPTMAPAPASVPAEPVPTPAAMNPQAPAPVAPRHTSGGLQALFKRIGRKQEPEPAVAQTPAPEPVPTPESAPAKGFLNRLGKK